MRITRVDIPEDLAQDLGLQAIKMDRLGPMVFLAGRNGSGKSRLLLKIVRLLSPLLQRDDIFHQVLAQNPYLVPSSFTSLQEFVSEVQDGFGGAWWEQLRSVSECLELSADEGLPPDMLIKKVQPMHFVPRPGGLSDPESHPPKELRAHAGRAGSRGVRHLPKSCLAKLKHAQEQWFRATHPDLPFPDEHKASCIDEYERLKNMVQAFVGTDLDMDSEGRLTLFSMPAAKAALSDGQNVLLQLAVALHSQGRTLDDAILFLDEPENHLHPAALREFLDTLKKHVKQGQIWVATHSVHVLAQADPADIWYMEDGRVSYAGRTPEHVLRGLLGDDEEIGKLADFMALPARLASIHFAAECLRPPGVVMTGADDPQTTQISRVLHERRTPGKPLRVLDHGAGQGRLLRTLAEQFGAGEAELAEHIDYFAHDPSPEHAETCKALIEAHYEDKRKRHFHRESDLKTAIDKHSVDVVVMCNVFHEISPEKWVELFGKRSLLSSLLRPEGYLLIVEDQHIPVGEKAHQKGFLVLDELQFKSLFAITEADTGYEVDRQRDGRLKAHLIPAAYLERVTDETRKEAIEALRDQAKEEVQLLRDAEASYRNGKLHAFWTQQWVNAELTLGVHRG